MPSRNASCNPDTSLYHLHERYDQNHKKRQANATTGASAAGIRAISSQFIAFYFRAPVKAFFRTRVDYMAYARAINPRVQAGDPWSWRTSTPGLLAHAVKVHGWSFIPNQILPPMMANVSIGAVLYTSYLQSLGFFHVPSSLAEGRTYPPPAPQMTFAAGFVAGTIQSVVAAPLDALQVRFRTSEMLEGRYKSMWQYAYQKLSSIGLRGIFAGWTLSFLKDSWSYAVFFSTFEYVKAQSYYDFLPRFYRNSTKHNALATENGILRPHYLIEPTFILAAGVLASVAQQTIQHPINQIQTIHFNRLESLDYTAKLQHRQSSMLTLDYHAYLKTYDQAKRQARRSGGWHRLIYRDFLMSTVRQVPSTSAGLIVFEVVRRKYASTGGESVVTVDGLNFAV